MDTENNTEEVLVTEGATGGDTTQSSEDTSSSEGSEQTQTEGTGESAEQASAKEAKEPAKTATTDKSKQTPDKESAAAQPAFVPSYKFKVAGKDQEIPKEFQALIKDEKSQKQIQKLFEDAHGIEPMKQNFVKQTQEITQKLGEANQELGSYREKISYAAKAYQESLQEGKIHRFEDMIRALNIDENQLMKFAVWKAQMAQLPPEQKTAVQAQIQAQRDAEAARAQQEQYQQQATQATTQAKQMEFNYVMSHPSTQMFAQELDGKLGREGLFMEEVINTGKLVYQTEGRNLSVPEAVQMVAQKYGLTGKTQPAGTQGGTGGAAAMSANGKPIVQKSAATIPNVGGNSAASPVGQQTRAKTTAEMRKMSQERELAKIQAGRA